MNPDIQAILSQLEHMYQDKSTALHYQNAFQLLVSTMLAAQSTDTQVNIVTGPLFKRYPTAFAFSELSVSELEEHIKTVGLYKTKARNIAATVRILAEQYNGDIPSTREELVQLPGVGRKTANVVLSIARGVPAIAVDTHVFRVSNRLGLADAKNVLETEKQLMAAIPQEKWSAAHHWLIWHGRQICKARNPLCARCPLNVYCKFYKSVTETVGK